VSSIGRPLHHRPTAEERRREVLRAKTEVRLAAAREAATAAVEEHRGDLREALGLPREYREFTMQLATDPTWDIDIIDPARRTIEAEAWASDDHTETGGWLIGYPIATRGYVVVLHATGPGPGAQRMDGAVILDRHHGDRFANARGLEIIGAWHVHPVTAHWPFDDPARISNNDARCAARHLDDLDALAFIELIVNPGTHGLLDQTLSPYVLIAQPDTDPPTVERARLR
jgi:hypothetical protein